MKYQFRSIESGKWDKTGLSTHAKNCHGQIDWNGVKTLKTESNKFDRKVREALEIQRNETGPENGMNLDHGMYVTSGFWKPLMKYINRSDVKCI